MVGFHPILLSGKVVHARYPNNSDGLPPDVTERNGISGAYHLRLSAVHLEMSDPS